MSRIRMYWLSGLVAVIVLIGLENVSGAEQSRTDANTPAILASMDVGNVTLLTDQVCSEVRGAVDRSTLYVMSSLAKLSSIDAFSGGGSATFTANPNSWRYGYWGGANWTDGLPIPSTANHTRSGSTVDSMDTLFRAHDNAYFDANGNREKINQANRNLLIGLMSLTRPYVSSPANAPTYVKIFTNFSMTQMRFSEYARRQAVVAFTLKVIFLN